MMIKHPHRLALSAAVIGLVATGLAAPGVATAQDAGGPAPAKAGTGPFTVAGLHDAAYHVTLLTGDQVTLTSSGQGRYNVTATPAPGPTPTIRVTARSGPHGVTSMSAVPVSAAALVADGKLDSDLFDLEWLAAHGDNAAAGSIPVTVQFSGKLSATALTGRAAALDGATLVAAHPEAGTVDVKVDAARAAPFWAALTAAKPTGASAAPHLAGGVVRAWPTGDRSAPGRPATDHILNQVTETITRTRGDVLGCNGYLTLLCVVPGLSLYGVAGDGTGTIYPATGMACVDTDPCTTYRVTYEVPSGIYSASGFAFFLTDQHSQNVDLVVPQITVAGDTALDLDVDAATKFSVGTPRPSQAFTTEQSDQRGAVDGSAVVSLVESVDPNYWAVPSAPVTAGTFHLTSGWVLGQPPLTMTVTAPQRLALDPTYFIYRSARTAGNIGAVRFTGHRSVRLVDAGSGRQEDFAGIDARGKLALIHLDAALECAYGSEGIVLDSQLNNAIQAGAVGLLIDPTGPDSGPGGYCSTTLPEWYQSEDPIDMPFAQISAGQAATLRTMLAHHPVTIDVNGYDGNSPYIYTPTLYQEGRVPASLHTTLTDAQLTTVTNAYHAASPGAETEIWSKWRSNEFFGGATSYEDIAVPGTIVEYRGPAAPDVADQWWVNGGAVAQIRWDAVTQPGGRSTETWGAAPEAPGASTVSPDLLRDQPGKYSGYPNVLALCSFCRQGNTLYPMMYLESGADPALSDGVYGFLADGIHLYHEGQEVAQTPFSGGLVSYQLPAAAARYQLVARDGGTTTTWDFTSAAPANDRTPEGTACVGTFLGSSSAPCAPDPFIFLRYDAGTDLTNAVTGTGTHQLHITAYRQAPGAVSVRSLKVWTSTDGGKAWTPATVVRDHDGSYVARYTVPTTGAASPTLSIRTQATDADGNDITQTIVDAAATAR